MAKKPEPPHEVKRYHGPAPLALRDKAFGLWVELGSLRKTAKAVGYSLSAVCKWKSCDKWEERAREVKEKAKQKSDNAGAAAIAQSRADWAAIIKEARESLKDNLPPIKSMRDALALLDIEMRNTRPEELWSERSAKWLRLLLETTGDLSPKCGRCGTRCPHCAGADN